MTSGLGKPSASDILSLLAVLTRELRDTLTAVLADNTAGRVWLEHQSRFCHQTGIAAKEDFADAVAQAVACGCFGLRCFHDRLQDTNALAWLIRGATPLVRDILVLSSDAAGMENHPPAVVSVSRKINHFLDRDAAAAIRQSLAACDDANAAAVYFFEQFLAAYDKSVRRSKGVFYTPQALASFVVRSIDNLLREEFSLAGGLADETTWQDLAAQFESPARFAQPWDDKPFVRLLDPAMGTGAFLLEAAEVARQRFHDQIVPPGTPVEAEDQLWNEFVPRSLLPRICGQDLMLPPLVLAHLAMTAWLAKSGFRFSRPGQLQFLLANTLQHPDATGLPKAMPSVPFTIILGNPPFSGVSDNRHVWMRDLLRGRAPAGDNSTGRKVASYFLSQGRPLQEKKHWLEDDYVKFIRFAHWQIEKARTGIVAFVTNHGYLDNSTFRGMREQLLATFPRINIIDLHGNTRNGERSPDGGPDQSVFGIEQGVAVSLLRRPPCQHGVTSVAHAELWGDRVTKIQTLQEHTADSLDETKLQPQSPYFFFVPKNGRLFKEYDAGYRLCDAMPVNSTAVVTARDGFVVAFDDAELQERLRQFADPRISDEEIRSRFFANTRSRKYPPGDTRGWKVAEARQRLRDEPDWQRHIRPCLYRPFDQRWIYWVPWMIDWPRKNVTDHLVSGGNLALIARRQMPPAQPCDYFWVSDSIALDGVIRSDNRGSESIFPLYLCGPPPSHQKTLFDRTPPAAPNFSDEFIEACTARLGLAWSPGAQTAAAGTLTPHDLFHYIYALFHCPGYRQRFAAHLCLDFPRILIPRHRELFFELVSLGEVLVRNHLLRRWDLPIDVPRLPTFIDGGEPDGTVAPGHPRFEDQAIWLNKTTGIGPVERDVWAFRVGTYQVCRKWLKDRRQREISPAEFDQYRRMLQAIAETTRTMATLDRRVDDFGGWETAF